MAYQTIIYAIERKEDTEFIGTVALVKDISHIKVLTKDELKVLEHKFTLQLKE